MQCELHFEMDVYICCPGEYVIYFDTDSPGQNGTLCKVCRVKSGKVLLTIVPTAEELLCNPQQLLESGEYGIDAQDEHDCTMEGDDFFDEDDELNERDGMRTDVEDNMESPTNREHSSSDSSLLMQGKLLHTQKMYAPALEVISPLCSQSDNLGIASSKLFG